MSSYAVANLTNVNFGDDIVAYLRGIDATLGPYQGRFIIHGGSFDRLEGNWKGDLIVIEFPDRARARAWYDSEQYRAIARLRTDNASSDVILIDGVSADHKATDILEGLNSGQRK